MASIVTPHSSRGWVADADWVPTGVDELEPGALDAIREPGCTLVVAGPGAGKTEFLAQKAAYLLQTGRCGTSRRILAISFKRDAAANLGRRVSDRLPEFADRFDSYTFDAFTKGLVDRFHAALPDTWRLSIPYQLVFRSDREVADFLHALAQQHTGSNRRALFALPRKNFLSSGVGSWQLPSDLSQRPVGAHDYALRQWWHEHYLQASPQNVDFVMINRLAELIALTNQQIRRGLTATYPFVFVDEFQDTTYAQFGILKSLFGGTTIVTAVGDDKQKIMGWAGAHDNALDQFEADFGAQRHHLTWNFRSTDDLIALQHQIAQRLDATAVRSVSKAIVEAGHTAVSVWTYSSQQAEATHLANWIAADIQSSTRRPKDFVFVARQRVADYQAALSQALAIHGIALRNDDVNYDAMKLQDLLKHELTRLLLGLLRLAVTPFGHGTVYLEVTNTLARISAVSSDEQLAQLGDATCRFGVDLRRWLDAHDPRATEAKDVLAEVLRVADWARVRGYVASAHRGDDADRIIESLTARMNEVMAESLTWDAVVDAVEAADAVALMTIHRSKGLEYHTVIFLGLDDKQWWSHSRNPAESLSTFFVGLSRAAQRLVFTNVQTTGTADVADLYAALAAVGVGGHLKG